LIKLTFPGGRPRRNTAIDAHSQKRIREAAVNALGIRTD